jgi:microcystin-dependent protein
MRYYTCNIIIIYALLFISISLFSYTFYFSQTQTAKVNKINALRSLSDTQSSAQYIACSDELGNVNKIGFPTGMILIWYPPNNTITSLSLLSSSVPTGWAVCDGTNGTPDLRGRFVLMAQDSVPVDLTSGLNIPFGSSIHSIGSTGGEETHLLTIPEMPDHSHNGGSAGQVQIANWNNNVNSSVYGTTSPSGGNTAHSILPSHYTLVYLMKL